MFLIETLLEEFKPRALENYEFEFSQKETRNIAPFGILV